MRAAALAAALGLALALAACKRNGAEAPPQTPPADDAASAKLKDTMANTDDPWKQAEAIAEEHAGRPVKKRSDELPYFFHYATGRGGVLVHEGKVVTDKGPAAAARYLADIGIVEGPGPSMIQVATILRHLEAFPKVGSLDPESYITKSPIDSPANELGAEVVRENGTATIVLSYWSSKSKARGAPSRPVPRRVARAELTIGGDAEPEWKVTSFEWLPPDQRPETDAP